jgi:hypothetical protein
MGRVTIQDVANQIIIHFCEKDTFTLDDAAEIDVDPTLEANQFDLVLTALGELEEAGLIKSVGGYNDKDPEDEPFWILSRPMQGVGQDVRISIQTAIIIKDTIEQYMAANGLPHDSVNPFAIHEGHIRRVLEIVSDILDKEPPADPASP